MKNSDYEEVGYQPSRPHANFCMTEETQVLADELARLEREGELFIGESPVLNTASKDLMVLIEKFQSSFAADLRRFLGAEDDSNASSPSNGLLTRVNMWMQIISWTDGAGYTYWGVHDYLRGESRYMGKTRGSRLEP